MRVAPSSVHGARRIFFDLVFADDEEAGAEEYVVVAEHVRHDQRRDEHRDQRDKQRGADDALLGGRRSRGVTRCS
jgi:hypothetical protein